MIINSLKYFPYLFKKIFFFIKHKNLFFLIYFFKTELAKIKNRYLIKKFNTKLNVTIDDYLSQSFVTHNEKTKKWFIHNIVYILSMIEEFDLNSIKNEILEIGSYEGNSSLFFLKNIKDSNITCVDIWSDDFTSGNKNRKLKFTEIKKNFDINLLPFKDRLTVHKITSNEFFKINKNKFDLIYIDGSHVFEDVLNDGNNSIKILNHNGLIIFDDFLKDEVFVAILEFYKKNKKNLKVEYIYHQAIFRYKEMY